MAEAALKAAKERKPWEQIPWEPDPAYKRFWTYCGLGPGRSLDKAYNSTLTKATVTNSNKPLQATGQWASDSAKYEWVDRANAWDLENITEVGRNTVVTFVSILEQLAKQTLHHLEVGSVMPSDWGELVSSINALGNFIPAETVEAIRDNAERNRPPAVGSTKSDK